MTSQRQSKPKPGEFEVDFEHGRGWFVIDPKGERSERSFANRNAALSAKGYAAAQAARLSKCRERACLTCGTKFMSEGPHNRMCGPCRHLSPGDPSQTPQIQGRRFK